MSYSQALEEQVKLLRFMESGDFRDFERKELDSRKSMGLANDFRTEHQYDIMRLALESGDPYYWSPSVLATLEGSAESLPDFALSPDLLPTRAGFWWFSTPIGIGDEFHGIPMQWRGLMWVVRPTEREVCLAFVFSRAGYANLFPASLVAWEFGRCADDIVGKAITRLPEIAALKELGTAKAIEGSKRILARMRAFCAGLLFMRQRIFIASQTRAERHVRKRLERDGVTHEPLVRVVELRRKHAHSERHGDSEPVEWSHQWVVSGHWRQQWYPSLNAKQPRWIMPYVKGPEDKPLKPPRAKVFAVVR